MKFVTSIKAQTVFVISFCIMTGCGDGKQPTDDFITVDVTAKYPKKELILQDFLDVEYIPLETNEEFITLGNMQTIGKDIIITRNRTVNGDIFVFDRNNGKALRHINRSGQGSEEYITIFGIILDEENSEMFVNDYRLKKVLVYDLFGKFKRSFKHKEGYYYNHISNFDRNNLICRDDYSRIDKERNRNTFLIVSKQDGSVSKEIQIPFKEKKLAGVTTTETNGRPFVEPIHNWHLIPYHEKRILVEPSSDTIYSYSPNHQMTPFIVRTPSIQSMEPEVFLFPSVLTDRYYFMQTVKNEFDFVMNAGFPKTNLVYDRQEKAIYENITYNGDFSNKKLVNLAFELTPLVYDPVNNEIAFMEKIDAYELVEAYKNGQLKGKLKEVAAKLDEESNPVIMIAKYKQ